MSSELALRFWESGKLSDCPILDFHAHMGPLASMYFPACEPEDMIKTMKRCGTRLTVFSSHLALTYPEGALYDLETAGKYPEYFKAYHTVLANRTDFGEMVERLESHPSRYFGLKFHCDTEKTPLTDDFFAPFLSYINKRRMPALLHTWGHSVYNGAEVVARAAEKYPDVTFICGHSFHDDWHNGAKLAKSYPNLYYELTAVMDNYGAIELLCEEAGSERILFGTDLPWFDTHHGISAILSADITDEDRRNIFYRNGEKLLGKL